MIFIKGLVDFKGLKKFLISILALLGILFLSFLYNEKIDDEIFKYNNVVYHRTLNIPEEESVNLKPYKDIIESTQIEDGWHKITFKTYKEAKEFCKKEESVKSWCQLDSYDPKLRNSSYLIKGSLVILNIFLFILIIVFTINYLIEIVREWRLYQMLGYKNKLIFGFYFIFLSVIYSLIYSVFYLVMLMLGIWYSAVEYIVIIFAILIALLVINKHKTSSNK